MIDVRIVLALYGARHWHHDDVQGMIDGKVCDRRMNCPASGDCDRVPVADEVGQQIPCGGAHKIERGTRVVGYCRGDAGTVKRPARD